MPARVAFLLHAPSQTCHVTEAYPREAIAAALAPMAADVLVERARMRELIVTVSIDTEEDNWLPSRTGITVENVAELPRLQDHCDLLGVPLTYLTTYQVAVTPWAAGVLRDLQATGRAEVAAHLHPQNTPPLEEPFLQRNTMLCNLPLELQRAKLATLTRTIEEGTGVHPSCFRAGRFGLGRETIRALIEQGYRVDTSVTPWVSWTDTDDGPDFVGAPLCPYTLDGTTDPWRPVSGGPLLEIPVSSGYSRWPFERWHRIHCALQGEVWRRLRVASLAVRIGVVRPVMLNPELNTARDMMRLARLLVSHGAQHLSVIIHSSSLVPGLNPFAPNRAAVERLYAAIADLADYARRIATPVFTTVSGAARRLKQQLDLARG